MKGLAETGVAGDNGEGGQQSLKVRQIGPDRRCSKESRKTSELDASWVHAVAESMARKRRARVVGHNWWWTRLMVWSGRSLWLEDGRTCAARDERTNVGVHVDHSARDTNSWCHLILNLRKL